MLKRSRGVLEGEFVQVKKYHIMFDKLFLLDGIWNAFLGIKQFDIGCDELCKNKPFWFFSVFCFFVTHRKIFALRRFCVCAVVTTVYQCLFFESLMRRSRLPGQLHWGAAAHVQLPLLVHNHTLPSTGHMDHMHWLENPLDVFIAFLFLQHLKSD